jgi:hypothetical protein
LVETEQDSDLKFDFCSIIVVEDVYFLIFFAVGWLICARLWQSKLIMEKTANESEAAEGHENCSDHSCCVLPVILAFAIGGTHIDF